MIHGIIEDLAICWGATTQPTIRLNTGTILYPWFDENGDPIPEVLEYMAANGVEVMDSLQDNALTDPLVAQGIIDGWQVYRDFGIKVWCHMEISMQNIEGVWEWATQDYNDAYHDCMVLYEAEGDYMLGFSYEVGFDTGAEWLHDRAQAAGKKILWVMWMSPSQLEDPNLGGSTLGVEGRMPLADELVIEIYAMDMLDSTMELRDAVMAIDPTYKLGVFTRFGPGYENDTGNPWGEQLDSPTEDLLSWREQHRRASLYLPTYKPTGRNFDSVSAYPCYPYYCGHSVIEQIEYLISISVGEIPITPAEIDNLTDFTMEFQLKFDSFGENNEVVLFSKKQSSEFFGIQIYSSGEIGLYRGASVSGEGWRTDTGIINLDTPYTIQISWESGTGPSPAESPVPPIITVNDVDRSVTRVSTGIGLWDSDAGNPVILGTWAEGEGYTFLGTWYLYRLHTAVLTPEERHENYLHDKWRYEGMEEPSIETISPNVSVNFDAAWAWAEHIEAGEIAVLAPSFGELSTVVNLGTLECGGTETLFAITPTDITVHPTTITNAMEIFNPITPTIKTLEILPFDAVVTDSLSLNTILTDTLSLNATITDSVEFDIIVAEEET